MRREERVTVQGPTKEQQPDGMSHRGRSATPKARPGDRPRSKPHRTHRRLCCAAVFVVCLVLLANIWSAVLVLLMVGLIDVNILGFMHWVGLSYNSVTTINILLAIGISVDYAVHIAHAYLSAFGTRQACPRRALRVKCLVPCALCTTPFALCHTPRVPSSTRCALYHWFSVRGLCPMSLWQGVFRISRSQRGGGGDSSPKTPYPPPSPDQSDHRGNKRNLQSGKSGGTVLGTQILRSQTPSPPPLKRRRASIVRRPPRAAYAAYGAHSLRAKQQCLYPRGPMPLSCAGVALRCGAWMSCFCASAELHLLTFRDPCGPRCVCVAVGGRACPVSHARYPCPVPQDRAFQALCDLGGSVLNGGLTTFMALIPLGLSDSYVFKVFFRMFALIIGFGLFHGVLVQPVLLSLIGPSSNPLPKGLYEHDHQYPELPDTEVNKPEEADTVTRASYQDPLPDCRHMAPVPPPV